MNSEMKNEEQEYIALIEENLADLRAAHYFGEVAAGSSSSSSNNNMTPDQTAVTLSQILYSRRGFPYYSFCVVAGLSDAASASSVGQVYGYDAIGSYEQLAATCSGTGRQLMQPILDRKFKAAVQQQQQQVLRVAALNSASSTATSDTDASNKNNHASSSSSHNKLRIVNNIPATHVDCETPEEAVKILLAAYRSVSEREIGVGDHVVFYAVQRMAAAAATAADGKYTGERLFRSRIWTAPLKKH